MSKPPEVPQYLIDEINQASVVVFHELAREQADFDKTYFKAAEFDMEPGLERAFIKSEERDYSLEFVADSKYGPIVEMTICDNNVNTTGLFVFAGSLFAQHSIKDLRYDLNQRLCAGLIQIIADEKKFIQPIRLEGEDYLNMYYTYRLCLGGNIILLPVMTGDVEADNVVDSNAINNIPTEEIATFNKNGKFIYTVEMNPVIAEAKAHYIEVVDVLGWSSSASIT